MRIESKANAKHNFLRICFVLVSLLIQVGWYLSVLKYFYTQYAWFSLVLGLIAACVAVGICGKSENAAFHQMWIMLLLLFPPFGLTLFLLVGHNQSTRRMSVRYAQIMREVAPFLTNSLPLTEEYILDIRTKNLMYYLQNSSGFGAYATCSVEYFPLASDGFFSQMRDIAGAREFIFLEYHAIEEGEAFGKMLSLLEKKSAEGVEVRILYDDIGSIAFLNRNFQKRMEQKGIACRAFNQLHPILHIFLNNRDHRKITVIDGKIGFTGGYNLADEYFNLTHPYGFWKDTGIKIEGQAVCNLTAMFLCMWNSIKTSDTDFSAYFPQGISSSGEGLLLPYADSPVDERREHIGENVYLSLIANATRRLWITTPYLIISDEMIRELTLAACRGVDVRILTPGIPDKKLVYRITRSYYTDLVQKGVRIYEYSPGFLHCKQMLCDKSLAVIGTINLDYRSLYHHFENAVLLSATPCLADMESDFLAMYADSREVTKQYQTKKHRTLRQSLWRLLAPLL